MKKVEVCVCVRERERKRDRDKYVSMKEVEVCEDREEKCIRKRERVPIGKRKIIYMQVGYRERELIGKKERKLCRKESIDVKYISRKQRDLDRQVKVGNGARIRD